MPRATAGTRFPGLDGLRGIAIALVLLFHFGALDNPYASRAEHALLQLFSAGWIGVELFFVLSGFLITNLLLAARGTERALRTFWGRRLFRIFPVYYLTLAVCLFVLPAVFPAVDTGMLRERQIWLWAFVSNLWPTLREGWGFATDRIDLNHTWSLAIEEQFYVFWPLIVLHVAPRHVLRVALAWLAVSLAARLAIFHLGLQGVGSVAVYTFTPVRLDGLLLGAALAIGAQRGVDVAPRFSRLFLPAAVLPALAALYWRGPTHADSFTSTYGFSLVAIASAALVAMSLRPAQFPRLAGLLNARVLGVLGRYSYGIYLFHGVLRPWVTRTTIELAGDYAQYVMHPLRSAGVAVALGTAASGGLALASYHLLEAPFLRLKERVFPAR